MNPAKSECFISGYEEGCAREVRTDLGIVQGSFPTRYLGLPPIPGKLNMAALQPFIERITRKLHSWTPKFLSYAGKIKMVSSVIYGMVIFWSQVFVLPKAFHKKVDSVCFCFLMEQQYYLCLEVRVFLGPIFAVLKLRVGWVFGNLKISKLCLD
ncbi:hypothetical protein V5N11_018117 [Cardamine amara subsp. amara]|uniref:Reverse transcriptase n=1 Tax=Cardamine amara subsp. amara TaxID=228776 RepID=A0ABD1AGY6_CARAN